MIPTEVDSIETVAINGADLAIVGHELSFGLPIFDYHSITATHLKAIHLNAVSSVPKIKPEFINGSPQYFFASDEPPHCWQMPEHWEIIHARNDWSITTQVKSVHVLRPVKEHNVNINDISRFGLAHSEEIRNFRRYVSEGYTPF